MRAGASEEGTHAVHYLVSALGPLTLAGGAIYNGRDRIQAMINLARLAS
ncbi:MAG TPA: hypothetical protein VGL63_02935 [Streptosporangiaceae bacterium]